MEDKLDTFDFRMFVIIVSSAKSEQELRQYYENIWKAYIVWRSETVLYHVILCYVYITEMKWLRCTVRRQSDFLLMSDEELALVDGAQNIVLP